MTFGTKKLKYEIQETQNQLIKKIETLQENIQSLHTRIDNQNTHLISAISKTVEQTIQHVVSNLDNFKDQNVMLSEEDQEESSSDDDN